MKPIRYRAKLGPEHGAFSLALELDTECPVCHTTQQIVTYSMELSKSEIEQRKNLTWLVNIASEARACTECGVTSVIVKPQQATLEASLREQFTSEVLQGFVQQAGALPKKARGRTPQGGLSGGDEYTYDSFAGGTTSTTEWVDLRVSA